ncbi:uncharacterized protein (TIGR02679 family) [Kribbella sp. VKM Ac-2571]|uniref:DUF2399 domain-containing protein n=1 Tax=Kribbella sp. VKM Ac-2571 TaxID=2512222 RepID=UPI0010ED4955|nr:DUF2399 domain-containing protein [Kribbella sp. VKM Ac-2571]TDO56686.1 uncharacterized protein (TIGR02679 family) [Kribbella sp. VKM Ac-2571]
MRPLPAALEDWVRMPGPAAVLEAIVGRAHRGFKTESGSLGTVALTEDERRQVAQLLGTPWELSGRPVRLQDLAARLGEHGLSVRELAEASHGRTIEPDSVRRKRAASAGQRERSAAASALATAGVDPSIIEQWIDDRGLPRPGTGDLQILAEQVADVLGHIRRSGRRIWLAQLAADVFNDAHRLDANEPLGRAVARLAAVTHRLPRPQRAGRDWRAAWASIGVTCDAVSSRVLALNLPLDGDSPATHQCSNAPGEPVWLTLRALTSSWSVHHPATIFVCENVTIAQAAADELGPDCPPLVCTDGIASGAALDLLAGLSASGCTIEARADFDQAGFTIADQILSVAPDARSWRYDATTYAAICDLPNPPATSRGLSQALSDLRVLYAGTRTPVHEERLLGDLLADLTARAPHLAG